MLNKLNIDDLIINEYKLQIRDCDDGVILYKSGKLNGLGYGKIFNKFYMDLHQKLVDNGIKKLIVDHSSVGLSDEDDGRFLIKLIMLDAKLEKTKQYEVIIRE